MIKRAWLTKLGGDGYMLSIREFNWEWDNQINMSSYELPPVEPVRGAKLNIEEARELNLSEPHHQIGILLEEDLVAIRDAINKVLGYE